MGLGADKAKQRREERGSGVFKFKPGANRIRVFVFQHKVTKDDVKASLFPSDKKGNVEDEIDRLLVIQFGIKKRPVLATTETIARYEKLNNSTKDADKEAARKCRPQNKYAINIVDTDERPYKMHQILAPVAVDSAIWDEWDAKREDGVDADEIFGLGGRDFIVTFDKNATSPKDYYKVTLRDASKSAKLPEELLEQVVDFYSPQGMEALGLESVEPEKSETSLDDGGDDDDSDDDE